MASTYAVQISGITYDVTATVDAGSVFISSVRCHGYEIGDDEFEALVSVIESDVLAQYRETSHAKRVSSRDGYDAYLAADARKAGAL